ncbi:hypothetical protein IWZ01DRAFT_366632 [Phyllosticta capitalensis]
MIGKSEGAGCLLRLLPLLLRLQRFNLVTLLCKKNHHVQRAFDHDILRCLLTMDVSHCGQQVCSCQPVFHTVCTVASIPCIPRVRVVPGLAGASMWLAQPLAVLGIMPPPPPQPVVLVVSPLLRTPLSASRSPHTTAVLCVCTVGSCANPSVSPLHARMPSAHAEPPPLLPSPGCPLHPREKGVGGWRRAASAASFPPSHPLTLHAFSAKNSRPISPGPIQPSPARHGPPMPTPAARV